MPPATGRRPRPERQALRAITGGLVVHYSTAEQEALYPAIRELTGRHDRRIERHRERVPSPAAGPVPAPAAGPREEVGFWAWRLEAACGGLPSSVFFSPDGERGAARRRRERAAKAICAGCRVREQCACYALTHRERHGVWGGLSEHERAMIWNRQGGRAT